MNVSSKEISSPSYFVGFLLVFFAGILWSFGALTVKYMINGQNYAFQYLFLRGLTVTILLVLYLIIHEGLTFYKSFFKVGISGILGGIFLSTAMIGFIFSITMTTAAVTLFMLASMPFIAAISGYFVLGEKLRPITLVSMIIAFFGVLIMVYNDSLEGSALGALIGFISASGFAFYTVTIRWKPETPKFTTVVFAGIFCSIFSIIILGFSFESFQTMPIINSYLSLLHGTIVASGLILYSLGARYLPAAELTLLSLMEVVGGILWVWLPIFGINEVPSLTVVIGGLVITSAVILYGVGANRKREPVTL